LKIIRPADTVGQRVRGAPEAINGSLTLFAAGVILLQFFVLPLGLVPQHSRWAWLLLPIVLLTNPLWSLIHDAILDLFHSDKAVNDVLIAKNLSLCRPLASLLVNFTLHGIYPINPALSWIDLPMAFEARARKYHGRY